MWLEHSFLLIWMFLLISGKWTRVMLRHFSQYVEQVSQKYYHGSVFKHWIYCSEIVHPVRGHYCTALRVMISFDLLVSRLWNSVILYLVPSTSLALLFTSPMVRSSNLIDHGPGQKFKWHESCIINWCTITKCHGSFTFLLRWIIIGLHLMKTGQIEH